MKFLEILEILKVAKSSQKEFNKIYYGIVRWMKLLGYPVDDPEKVVLDMDTLSGSYFLGEDTVTFSFTKDKSEDMLFIYMDIDREVVEVFANIQGVSEELLVVPLNKDGELYSYEVAGKRVEITEDELINRIQKLSGYIKYTEVVKHKDELMKWLAHGLVLGKLQEGDYHNRFVRNSLLYMLKNPTKLLVEALKTQLKSMYLGENTELDISGVLEVNLLDLLADTGLDDVCDSEEYDELEDTKGSDEPIDEEDSSDYLIIGAVEETPVKTLEVEEDDDDGEYEEL